MLVLKKKNLIKRYIEYLLLLGCVSVVAVYSSNVYHFHIAKRITVIFLIAVVIAVLISKCKHAIKTAYEKAKELGKNSYFHDQYVNDYKVAEHLTIAPFGPMTHHDPLESWY